MAVVAGVSLNLATGEQSMEAEPLLMTLNDYGSETLTYYQAEGATQVENDYLRHFGDLVGESCKIFSLYSIYTDGCL